MASGRAKRKRLYHQTPPSIDIRIKVWKCLRVSAQVAAKGMATATAYIVILLGYLTYLNPVPWLASTLKSLFTRQRPRRMLTYHNYQPVTYKPPFIERVKNTLKSEQSLKKELMNWLKTKLPSSVVVNDFRESWSNGVSLCALMEAVVPSTCPRYDLLKPESRVNNCRLGMTLIRKTLGIEEPMEPEEMSLPSRASETKLLRYIQTIRYASMIPVETPSYKTSPWSKEGAWPKKATFSEPVDEERKQLMEADKVDCTASGSGLVIAKIGKRAKFNVYTPKFIFKSLYIHIKGPLGESVRRKIINHLPGGRPHRDEPDSSNMSSASVDDSHTSSSASSASGGVIPCDYQCVREGHYEVSYIAQSEGAYEITVTWGGEQIRNSPFTAQSSVAIKRSLPDTDPSDPSRVVCFIHEKKVSGTTGVEDSEDYPSAEPTDNDVPLPSPDSFEQEYAPKYNTRARRRQSFCRQSHVTALRESYESGGSTSPYDSRCSSMIMSSTERSMDSDVFYPYGSARASSFISSSRRGLISSSSSRSSMMSHRSSSILSSGGDRPGTVRTRRKIIKRTIRGAGGKEEIQYPSSADMSSVSNTSSIMGMSMCGFSSVGNPNDQSSVSGTPYVSDERLTGVSSSASSAPSPTVLAPVPTLAIATRDIHMFADRIAKAVMGSAMYDLSKKSVLSPGISRGKATSEEHKDPDKLSKNCSDSDGRGLPFGLELQNLNEPLINETAVNQKKTVKTQMGDSFSNRVKTEESGARSKVSQSPIFLDVTGAIEDVCNKPVESQITIEFEPQLGADSSRNAKESSSNSSSTTASAEREHVDEESGYSTFEDTMRSSDRAMHLLRQVNKKDGNANSIPTKHFSAFEPRGFRPVEPSVDTKLDQNSVRRDSSDHIHTPKPQRQSKIRRRADKQTQCTSDDIKKETGWISRRNAFTKQKRREQNDPSMEKVKQKKKISSQPTTARTSLAMSDTSEGPEHGISSPRKRLERRTPSVENNTSRNTRQTTPSQAKIGSRSVARQSTFDSGYSDENGHIFSLTGRDRSNSSSKNRTIRVNNDITVANVHSLPTPQHIPPFGERFDIAATPNSHKDQNGEIKTRVVRQQLPSGSESSRNQLLSEKPRLGVENMIEDEEIIAVTNRRPSFSAINFDLSHLQHVSGSQDQEQTPNLSPGPISKETPSVENFLSESVNGKSLVETDCSSVSGEKKNDGKNQTSSYEAPVPNSTNPHLQGNSYRTLANEKDVPVSKLLETLENDPDFTIREFVRKFMPSLGGNLGFADDVLGRDADKLYPTIDALEQEMDSSWSELKSSFPSRAGGDTNSRKSSRRHSPRVGTPFSAHSSSDSYLTSIRPSYCQAMGMGIREGLVGVKNNFQVETSKAGEGSLAVFIRGPRPHTVNETSVTFTGDDLYEVVYEVNLAGFYVISVKWADRHIPDSPFIVQISF
nr:serine-rich adhesin for platelets-like [Lytechinus pictus]